MPTATKPIAVSGSLVTRFWAKVNQKDTVQCWLWTGNTVRGYGQIAVSHNQPAYAHRVSWVLAHGSIPDNLSVLHRCDVPLCVNPFHLFLGTQSDNLADARAKGRLRLNTSRTGKLTYADRLAIFFSGARGVDLARHYGVSKTCITLTRKGRFSGAPGFERVDPSTELLNDFNQLQKQARGASVGHASDDMSETVQMSAHNG